MNMMDNDNEHNGVMVIMMVSGSKHGGDSEYDGK